MKPGKITSLREIQLQVPRILEEHKNNQELALVALANPLAALEKIGYSFDPELRQEIEDRIRFGKKDAEKAGKLRKKIYDEAGKPFDLAAPDEVKKQLKIILTKPPATKGRGKKPVNEISSSRLNTILKNAARPVSKIQNKVQDPLKSYKKEHPIISALVDYRKIDASYARLADIHTIENILADKESFPIKNLTFRLHREEKS